MNFRLCDHNNACWDFDWDYIEIIDQFGESLHEQKWIFWYMNMLFLAFYLYLLQFQQYFVIFSVQVIHMFGQIYP